MMRIVTTTRYVDKSIIYYISLINISQRYTTEYLLYMAVVSIYHKMLPCYKCIFYCLTLEKPVFMANFNAIFGNIFGAMLYITDSQFIHAKMCNRPEH